MKILAYTRLLLLSAILISARKAEIASKLMHDIETNPGPCTQVSLNNTTTYDLTIFFIFRVHVQAKED